MAEQYPIRSAFFANRLIRLLQKSCAANEIGVEACWLVTCIALVEDAKRYTGPVTFWTGQLMPISGFQSWGRLDRCRQRAVEAGWLHYIPGTNRKAAKYWTLIPDTIETTFDDSPVDEVDHQNGDSSTFNHQNGNHHGDNAVIETTITRRLKRGSSIPTPNPITSETSSDTSDWFEQFWTVYSKKIGRKKAEAAFRLAVKAEAEARKVSPKDAAKHITAIAGKYAAGFKDDQRFQKYPTTWLNGEHWNDDPATLKMFQASNDDDWPELWQIVRKTYHPDLRNVSDVQDALTPEQFKAAKAVGLGRIANADQFDKETPEVYRAKRRAQQ